MDRRLREAFREFNLQPTSDACWKLFQAHLQSGQRFEISLFYQVPNLANRLNLTDYKIENFNYLNLPLDRLFQKFRLSVCNAMQYDSHWYQRHIQSAMISVAERFDPNTAAPLIKNSVRWFLTKLGTKSDEKVLEVYLTTVFFPIRIQIGFTGLLTLALERCPRCNKQTYLVEIDEYQQFHLDCFDENYVIEDEHTVQDWDINRISIISMQNDPTLDIQTFSAPENSIELPIR